MTVDTNTSSNNKTHNIEEKEQYDVNVDTSQQQPSESEINEMFGSFEEKQHNVNEGTDNNSEEKPSYTNTDVVDENEKLIPIFPDNFKSEEMDKLLEGFSNSVDNTKHPNREQLLCMAYLEKLAFCKNDFKIIYQKEKDCGHWKPNCWNEIFICLKHKLQPIAIKYNFKSRGFDCEVYRDMVASFLNKHYNYFKICVPNG